MYGKMECSEETPEKLAQPILEAVYLHLMEITVTKPCGSQYLYSETLNKLFRPTHKYQDVHAQDQFCATCGMRRANY